MMNDPPHLSLTLTLPPSLNRIWQPVVARNGKAKMIKGASYRSWSKTAGWEVLAARRGWSAPGWYQLRIVLPESGFDADNVTFKQISDALQHGGAIVNDKHLRRGLLDIDPTRPAGTLLVEVWAIGEDLMRRAPDMSASPVAPVVLMDDLETAYDAPLRPAGFP